MTSEAEEAMICASAPLEFQPFGRHYCSQHPGESGLPTDTVANKLEPEIPVESFRSISIKESSENWLLRLCKKHDCHDCDEELYISNRTVVWSHCSPSGIKSIVKSVTVDSKVEQALWTTFHIYPINSGTSEHHTTSYVEPVKSLASVCVIEQSCMSVFTDDGEDFITAIPFKVSQAWNTKFGILVERANDFDASDANSAKRVGNLPTLFSVNHPLHEFAPVISRVAGPTAASTLGKIQYVSVPAQHIVYSDDSLSLIVSYDTVTSVHSVWSVRRAKPEEGCAANGQVYDRSHSVLHSLNTTPIHALHHHSSASVSKLNLSSLHSPSLSSSLRLLSSRTNSPLPLGLHNRSQSPAYLAALSRSQSPAVGNSNNPYHYSMSYSTHSPGAVFARSPAKLHSQSLNESLVDIGEPLAPDICLDHIWTEYLCGQRDGMLGQASKVFITTDVNDQDFLCLYISNKHQLRCIKFDHCHDGSQLIFKTSSHILARDAIAINTLKMMVVLDKNHTLVLYTGTTKISKIHLQNLPIPPLSVSNMGPVTMPRPSTPLESVQLSTPSWVNEPLDDEVVMLSPVLTELNTSKLHDSSYADDSFYQSTSYISSLRDGTHNRFTIEMATGCLYRTSLPDMTSTYMVKQNLEALAYILPKDVTCQVLTRWYLHRNGLGSKCSHQEWKSFVRFLVTLLGYDSNSMAHLDNGTDSSLSSSLDPKRHRPSNVNSDSDWEYLLLSHFHRRMGPHIVPWMLPRLSCTDTCSTQNESVNKLNSAALLYNYLPSVLFGLHLVYEDMKLNTFVDDHDHEEMAATLCYISCDLGWVHYTDQYCRDYPIVTKPILSNEHRQLSQDSRQCLHVPSYVSTNPPNILNYLMGIIRSETPTDSYPYLTDVTQTSVHMLTLYKIIMSDSSNVNIKSVLKRISNFGTTDTSKVDSSLASTQELTLSQRAITYMTAHQINMQNLAMLPYGVLLPLLYAIADCHKNPPKNWSVDAYRLIGRQDLCEQIELSGHSHSLLDNEYDQDDNADGMDMDHEVLKLLFSEDLRIREVRRLLQSAKPVKINIIQEAGANDQDFIVEQEMRLLTLCKRTMSLPVGRGMFTLHTSPPVLTDPQPIPELNLTGKASPRNTTIDLQHIPDVPVNMNSWPLFHNGVATGLQIYPRSSKVDSPWILYNKPKSNDMTNDHAGFLMALGLSGHLPNLATLNIHDYLCKGHDMTSVGLLLGISAAKRGSMDLTTTRMLSIHIGALLPPTSTELDVPHVVQVASVVGIGLLYQATAHRHMAEVLLSEICRPPGPEMENCVDRESYSLAAGLALGMVMLGHGGDVPGLSDLNMADRLYHYMAGGHKQQTGGVPCYQVKEGDQVNINVTSPGGTMALALMFLKTSNRVVADWMKIPDTQYLLDFIRPDFLMLRVIARSLIMWDNIEPSESWVNTNIPHIVSQYGLMNEFDSQGVRESHEIDFQTMSQAHCNIVAGSCFAIGLCFAGSANQQAFNLLMSYCGHFMELQSSPIVDQIGKVTLETCLDVSIISLAMVMAGTGNLEALKLCRQLHLRTGPDMTYGAHMAIHSAIGLLYLGGCRYSLSTSIEAIAALLCSFYPTYPSHSNDNRYHLQALRHLYVLAAEQRILIPHDVDTRKPCYALIHVLLNETTCHGETVIQTVAPCLLPELHLIKEIKVLGDRHLPFAIDVSRNLDGAKVLLSNGGLLYVKQRAGKLPYADDPKGYKSLLGQSFKYSDCPPILVRADMLNAFSSDPSILNMSTHFCQQLSEKSNLKESEFIRAVESLLYDCLSQEKPELTTLFLQCEKSYKQQDRHRHTLSIVELQLISAFVNRLIQHHIPTYISKQYITSLLANIEHSAMKKLLENATNGRNAIIEYLSCGTFTTDVLSKDVAMFLVLQEIPFNTKILINEDMCMLSDCIRAAKSSGLSPKFAVKLWTLLNSSAG